MKEKLIAVIQARLGSTRLPRKVLLPLCGKPVLLHVAQRLSRVKAIDTVVVATSDKPENDEIRELCRNESIPCFSGSEQDVLDRFYHAALAHKAQHVIRVTADCPLVDPALIDKVVENYFQGGFDYYSVATGAGVANADFKQWRFPDGFDAEVFKFQVLATAWQEAKEPAEREHVTPFIWQRPNRFRMANLASDVDCPHLRVTLDHEADYELISFIYDHLYPTNPNFGLNDVLTLLSQHPQMAASNQDLSKQQNYAEFWKKKS